MQALAKYERARLSRDARFDGQFFVGVKTTGIYCRPICPANSPKSENIDFYPTAAAASEAGFRPCLRCRPECAPGTPAWHGTSTTVRRGLRLIASGALDDGNVENLADRLGVTSRHLRRLFSKHLGASPLSVAHTQRLHFAKRLIDQTDLPLAEIAIAAGYGSVRRFNDAFRKTYSRPPREIRRKGRDSVPVLDTSALSVHLSYRQPFDWQQLLSFMRGRAIPGVESVSDTSYARTVRINDRIGVIDVRHDPAAGNLVLTVHGVATSDLFSVIQKVREIFDLDAPVADIGKILARDTVLKQHLKAYPGIRVPGSWEGFELTVRAILGQQISVKAATTLSGRIVERYGTPIGAAMDSRFEEAGLTHLFPAPKQLVRAHFNNLGIVGARIDTIRRIAKAVVDGELDFDAAQDPDAFCERLTSIRGIGDWTAQYVAMRALKHPDAFLQSDLGLLRAFDKPDQPRMKPNALKALAEDWRPWRAYAALLLWSTSPNSGG
ncbi:MAG: DNA-3-methyladenine glycosylase 2 family protein [Woeseiaceae bacterium]|nr:DNA-3-methyladenine glycosylase 2 family protein [Woeseiaceae bacterium]